MENIDLPPGYRIEDEVDTLLLLGPDGSPVAVFSASGAVPEEIEKAAWDDYLNPQL